MRQNTAGVMSLLDEHDWLKWFTWQIQNAWPA